MGQKTIDQLVQNSPYEEPARYWRYDDKTKLFHLETGRRPAGYVVASPHAKGPEDPGIFIEIPLVNQIRPRVKAWRNADYPGVTGITRRLLDHWQNPEEFERRRFFFCQLEAVETLIWLTEADASEKIGIDILGDGGPFIRQCCKMATGTGKTIVMAMVIAWQVLNKVTHPQDPRFNKNVLVVAPGLTVKNRLSVLKPAAEGNYYDRFNILPLGMAEKLRQGKVIVRNWHALGWESEEQLKKRKSVDKRGPKSDEAYTRDVLGEMSRARNLLVINDEAHHAWRVNVEAENKYLRQRDMKDSAEEATIWVGGLDRLHRTRGILRCYDFSATPFTPSGKKSSEEALFGWIVSDFGLTDAIESGLVKTPTVAIRDNSLPDPKTYKSRLFHIYREPDVKEDLNEKADPEKRLPDLVENAYNLLGADWQETLKQWKKEKAPTPPVMITVCNRTETAARIKYAFESKRIRVPELCDPDRILHIDSKVLNEAEASEEVGAALPHSPSGTEDDDGRTKTKLTKAQQAELLRRTVDTVGVPGEPGETIQNVISVGMLSEGWDAKTVTHIMGLRAFSSQLLCEQVVGRGLRRTSYDVNPETGRFDPDRVKIFGVPFTFLPHEGGGNGPPPQPPTKKRVEPDPSKSEFEITWPNVIRVEHTLHPVLKVDWEKVSELHIDASQIPQKAVLAPVLDGRPDLGRLSRIEIEKLAREYRIQKIIFEATRDVFVRMKKKWEGNREVLLGQLVRIVEDFIRSDRVVISPRLFYQEELRRRLLLTLNMSRIVNHVWEAIRQENTQKLSIVVDTEHESGSTGEMPVWYTAKPCEYTEKSHINFCVLDSTWESADAFILDQSDEVAAWVKNDHLGFEVFYVYQGAVRKYRPDFLIRLKTGDMLILETKGQDTEQDKVKRQYLDEWTRAVNEDGRFGTWRWGVALKPGELRDILIWHTKPGEFDTTTSKGKPCGK